MHSVISFRKQHPIKAKEGITHPVIPHLEHNDYVLVEGILGYERLTVETELVYKPIILAKLIIPFVDTHGTDDAEALVRGRIGCTIHICE